MCRTLNFSPGRELDGFRLSFVGLIILLSSVEENKGLFQDEVKFS